MDHSIAQTEEANAGTEYREHVKIFHDGLSLWWTKDAQDYLKERGWYHRQIMCEGSTLPENNRYYMKVVGDSPELCRALNSYGFGNLAASMLYHSSLTSVYPVGDKRRFEMGTPKELWRTMTRCWEIGPTSERIVEDIEKLPRVLELIVEAEGCVVPDLAFRNGRRWRRADDKGFCKMKPKTRQRKLTNTNRICHPDCIEARNSLIRKQPSAAEAILDNVDAQMDNLLVNDGIDVDAHVDFNDA